MGLCQPWHNLPHILGAPSHCRQTRPSWEPYSDPKFFTCHLPESVTCHGSVRPFQTDLTPLWVTCHPRAHAFSRLSCFLM